MAFRMNDQAQIQWKYLAPGERIIVHTNSFVYEFEMDASRMALIMLTDLSTVPTMITDFVRSSRNVQEVQCDMDIDIDTMRAYLRPDMDQLYIGAGRGKTLTYLRLFAKGPEVPWDVCKFPMDLCNTTSHLIRRVEPVATNQPAVA